ncbi:hypothetical protein ACQPYA_03615 [Micromonospora sp. CA-263727]|uniref:hypothetical protein n=1 Tax=Micromonospora sp. CA-263727 TaxID=3239967 RepID=UPI003D94765D
MTPKDTAPADPADPSLLATRLRELFQTAPPGRGPYTEKEVASALTDSGHRISAEGIKRLLRSPNPNPTTKTLQALATFFDVTVGYLLGDEDELAEKFREVRVLARSMLRLTPATRAGIATIINDLLRTEEAARTGRTQRQEPPSPEQPT